MKEEKKKDKERVRRVSGFSDFEKKYIKGNHTITVTAKDYYSDSDNYPNEKAFHDFVERLDSDNKFFLYCINIDLEEINRTCGRKEGDRALRQIFTQLSQKMPIFRIQGTKFNVLLNEKFKNLDELFLTLDKYPNIYGKVIKDEYVTKGNYLRLQRKGIEFMYEDRENRTGITRTVNTKKEETISQNLKENDLNSFVIPFEDDFKADKSYEAEQATFKSDDAFWFATITIHESKPRPRDVKAYVFPTEYKPNMELVDCIVAYDDLVELNPKVYRGTNPVVPIDGMKLLFTTKFNSNNKLNVAVIQDTESLSNDIGEIDYEIDIHEGKYIPNFFGKRVSTNFIFPVKRNNKGLEEYVVFNSKTSEINYNRDGLYTGKQIYEVHRDFKGVHFVLAKKV